MHDNDEKLRLIAQGNELSARGHFFEARHHFYGLSKTYPECPHVKIAALNNNALQDRRRGKSGVASAIKIYHKVLKLSPNDVHALLSIGILMRETDPTTALTYLEKAFVLNANNAEIWRIKGWCYRELNDLEHELECYYEAQKIEPSLMIQGWIDSAKSRLRKLLMRDHDPQFPVLHHYLMKILHSEGVHHVLTEDYDAALECYREILAREPESVGAQNNVIEVLLKRSEQSMCARKFGNAREDVAQVLHMKPGLIIELQCKVLSARINFIEEIAERKKDSLSRTSSANDFWASEGGGVKRGLMSTLQDDNTRAPKKNN